MAAVPRILQKLETEDPNWVLVAAIDFGTTYSGYAFSFKTAPKEIHMNKNWGEGIGCQSYKTPTCVLTGPADQFEAFGYDAEQRYISLTEEGDEEKFCLFRNFKMVLHNKENLTLRSTVSSTNGTIRPAINICSMALAFMKNHLFGRLKIQTSREPHISHVRWVITVPAIWSEEAKQFMREAAKMAGLVKSKDSKSLLICLEPEVASIYCRQLPVDQFRNTEASSRLSLTQGMQYLVADCGGGTIDITGHEILKCGKVKELNATNGGSIGGTKVDEAFVQLMVEIFGPEFIQCFQENVPQQWFALMVYFTRVKKSFKNDGARELVIPLNYALGVQYQKKTGDTIDKAIAAKAGVSFRDGRLVITNKCAVKLFKPAVREIVKLVKQQMSVRAFTCLSHVFLVGGFGECAYLQEELGKLMKKKVTLLVPAEAQLAVIHGAVHFGHEPDFITSRIARKTYGLSGSIKFNPNKHDSAKKYMLGQNWCVGIFMPFIIKGNLVEIGKTLQSNRKVHKPDQTSVMVEVYSLDRSILASVEYMDNPDMKFLAKVMVDIPNIKKGMDREVAIKVRLGGTEMQVTAEDITSGTSADCVVDFLTS